jgi:ribonucleoside-diphosphate reductase beta chain
VTRAARAASQRDLRADLPRCLDPPRECRLDLGPAACLEPRRYGTRNPFSFLALQDVQEVTNFFERRVSAYQVGVAGEVAFDAAF